MNSADRIAILSFTIAVLAMISGVHILSMAFLISGIILLGIASGKANND